MMQQRLSLLVESLLFSTRRKFVKSQLSIKIIALLTALICTMAATAVVAQVSQDAPPAGEIRMAPIHSPAGPFSKGSKRVNIVAGIGTTWQQNYLIVGGGFSYFIADGLALGISGEGWVLNDPTFWKISPDIRYTFWKMDKFKPYVGAFYRRTFITGDFDDYDSWGGRAGVAYRQGNSYVSLGVVHEIYLDCTDTFDDCSTTYPELSFWFSF